MSASIGPRARSRARTLIPALALVAGLMVVLAAPAYAATTVVNCPADDLSAAITAAAPGDTLVITGTCSGNYVIGKKLFLLGSTGAVLDGMTSGTTLTVNAGSKVKVTDVLIGGGLASFGGGVYNNGTLTLVGSTVIGNTAFNVGGGIYSTGTLTVSGSTVIENQALAGAGIYNASGSVTLSNAHVLLNVANSHAGGGIYNLTAGSLIVTNSAVNGNSADLGGGIFNRGTASVSTSTLSDNSSNGGGGIENSFPGGDLTVSSSTFEGNSSTGLGGGIDNQNTAAVTNSTFSGNSANYGGGIATDGTLSLSSSTLSGNSADLAFGGGLYIGNVNATTFGSSILAGNSAAVGPDCWASNATAISNGYNLIGRNDDCIPIPQTGDQVGGDGLDPIDPLLIPLASNGGPTQTMALGLASTAVDTIPVGALGVIDSAPLCPATGATDQRGTVRPQGAACDMGAYELNSPWISAVTVYSGVSGSSPSVSGSITCSQGTSFAISITLTQKKLKAVGASPSAPCYGVAFVAPWTVSVAPGTFAPGTAKVSFTATVGSVTSKGKVTITLT